MQKISLQRVRKSTVLVLPVVMLTIMAASLQYYSFEMAPGSEEAGIAFRGFPFPILKSRSVFYAGYVGQLANKGGSEYIRNATNGVGWYQLFLPGLVANILVYGILAALIILLDAQRHRLIGIASNLLKKDGRLIGGAKIAGFLIIGGVSLFLAILFSFFVIAVVMDIFWI